MMVFDSIEAYILELERVKLAIPGAAVVGVQAACDLVLDAARGEIGHYQREDTGPFDPWAELADWTKRERVEEGFSENDPLERTGELRNSYGNSVHGSIMGAEGAVGSPLAKAVELELGITGGDHYLPARSVLGIATYRNAETAAELMALPVVAVLSGGVARAAYTRHAGEVEDIPF